MKLYRLCCEVQSGSEGIMAKSAEPNRRQEILQAAREIFRKKGFAEAHMSEIADLAGVAKGTVYLYFPSKLALLDALCNLYQEIISDAISDHLREQDTGEALKKAIHAGMQVASREKDLLQLLDLRLGLHIRDRDFENPRAQQMLREFFTERINRGDIKGYDPSIIADLTGGFVQWIIKAALLWKHGTQIKPQYEDTAIRMLQRALLGPELPEKKKE